MPNTSSMQITPQYFVTAKFRGRSRALILKSSAARSVLDKKLVDNTRPHQEKDGLLFFQSSSQIVIFCSVFNGIHYNATGV